MTKDNNEGLLAQIERYFNCELTDEEEMRLRLRIAHTSLRHPTVDEARAVMGIRRPAVRWSFMPLLAACSVAASLAVTVALGTSLLKTPGVGAQGNCIAYVNGEKITDEEAVLRLTIGNLTDLESGHEEVRESMMEDIRQIVPEVDKFEVDGNPFAE